jgi:hypothetical protein
MQRTSYLAATTRNLGVMPTDPFDEELLRLHSVIWLITSGPVTKGAKAYIGQHILSYSESKHPRYLTTDVGVSAVENAS